ncbi:protein disulfide-isomerase precursor [Coemansia thaxteri]|uniref:protein disulfide-isomerase n=1 Tax=Coemansia thaxteri TaxID=2663907 RepID=A0A9W8EJ99_9FUNG|nr:protein disulfide-isomerase precursor [Coemansia thaxteri]
MTADEVRKFVKTRSTPLLGEMSSETFHAYSRAGFPIGLLFFNGQESRKELEASILPVAKEFRGVVSFALVDASMYKRHASMFHLEHKWPAFAIQDISAQTKYPMDQSKQLTAEQVRSFVDAFTHGKLSPSYKSDPTPEHNDGNVYELVSKEFEHVAFDTAKDVLIEFYSPSCIYCRQLEPVYEELGRLLGHNSRLVIARMNGATNDVPSNDQALNFPGYPTIVMIRADDNEIITYEGDRSLESLVSFVKEHSARRVLHDNDEKPQGRQVYMPAHKVDAGLTPKERRHDEL